MKKHLGSNKAADSMIQPERFGDWTPSALLALFQPAAATEGPATISVAAASIASYDPHSNLVGDTTVSVALDYLARCNHPGANGYLAQIARAAHSRWLRLEALKRMGPKAMDEASRAILREYAQKRCEGGADDGRHRTTPEQIQVAALGAIAQVPDPSDAEFQAVLSVISAAEGSPDRTCHTPTIQIQLVPPPVLRQGRFCRAKNAAACCKSRQCGIIEAHVVELPARLVLAITLDPVRPHLSEGGTGDGRS